MRSSVEGRTSNGYGAIAIVQVLFAVSLWLHGEGEGVPRAASIASRVVAHAMGGLDGQDYLNCRECFEQA